MEWKLFWRYALDLSVLFPAAFLCLAPVWEFSSPPGGPWAPRPPSFWAGRWAPPLSAPASGWTATIFCCRWRAWPFSFYLRALRGALSSLAGGTLLLQRLFLLVVCSVLSVLLNARAELRLIGSRVPGLHRPPVPWTCGFGLPALRPDRCPLDPLASAGV